MAVSEHQINLNLLDNDVNLLYKGIPVSLTASLGTSLFVSPLGNNATAVKNRVDRPYATVQAAVDAAAVSGDTIILFPGLHAGNVASSVDKTISFFLYPNAILNGHVTTTGQGQGSKYEFAGHGSIWGNLQGTGNGAQFHIRGLKTVGTITFSSDNGTELSIENTGSVGDVLATDEYNYPGVLRAQNVELMGAMGGNKVFLRNVRRVSGRVILDIGSGKLTAIDSHFYKVTPGANIFWTNRNIAPRDIIFKGCSLWNQDGRCIHSTNSNDVNLTLLDTLLRSGGGLEVVRLETDLNCSFNLNVNNIGRNNSIVVAGNGSTPVTTYQSQLQENVLSTTSLDNILPDLI
jgi:hypothetical protein